MGLHDPVVDVLPPGRRPSTLREEVTVHHLLAHTSGIATTQRRTRTCPATSGYVLLGILLAEVSGMPFAEAVTARVLDGWEDVPALGDLVDAMDEAAFGPA